MLDQAGLYKGFFDSTEVKQINSTYDLDADNTSVKDPGVFEKLYSQYMEKGLRIVAYSDDKISSVGDAYTGFRIYQILELARENNIDLKYGNLLEIIELDSIVLSKDDKILEFSNFNR